MNGKLYKNFGFIDHLFEFHCMKVIIIKKQVSIHISFRLHNCFPIIFHLISEFCFFAFYLPAQFIKTFSGDHGLATAGSAFAFAIF